MLPSLRPAPCQNFSSQGAGIYFAVHQAAAVGTGLFGDFIALDARRSQSIFQCLFTSNWCHIQNRLSFFHQLYTIRQPNAIFLAKLLTAYSITTCISLSYLSTTSYTTLSLLMAAKWALEHWIFRSSTPRSSLRSSRVVPLVSAIK